MLIEIAPGNKLYMKPIPAGKKVAVIDVDDVLYPCTSVLMDYCNAKFSADHTIEANTGYNLESLYPALGTKEKLIKFLVHDYDYMCASPFYEYASHMLEFLQESGYYIAIVTSRGFHPEGYMKTYNMFKKHNLPFDALGTTRMGQSKLDFVLDHIHPDPYLLLEDNSGVMKEFHSFGTQVIKFVQPWNQDCSNHSHFVRQESAVQDFADIMKKLHHQ